MVTAVSDAAKTEKRGRGRPSVYMPTYCDQVIETLATGLSLTAFAGEIGVSRDTVNEWRRVHPEFSDAVKKAISKRVLALEKRLLTAQFGPQVTSTIFALKNADPDEWREKQSYEHTGANGGAIETVTRIELVAPGDGNGSD